MDKTKHKSFRLTGKTDDPKHWANGPWVQWGALGVVLYMAWEKDLFHKLLALVHALF